MNLFSSLKKNIDWVLLFLALTMTFLGMMTYYSVEGGNSLFWKQLISLGISLGVFFAVSSLDVRYLKNNNLIMGLYIIVILLFSILAVLGSVFTGAQSWFSLGFFAFQPTDLAKLVLVLLLAKYFFKRHVEINKFKHLLISGAYMGIIFLFLLKQPDLGSALIVFFIWFGMILLFGVSRKYVLSFIFGGVILVASAFPFLAEYQKKRIFTFLDPSSDLLGSGYNINQAHISLGSGGWFGKGVGEGTQTHLDFLPEYETDFIFSAFGEEWGFVGSSLLLLIFFIFALRILFIAYKARGNFETILALGILVYFTTHFVLHSGINLGFFPVTGTTLPFMSYGGSHLIVEFISLGIINSIRKTGLKFSRNDIKDTDILN